MFNRILLALGAQISYRDELIVRWRITVGSAGTNYLQGYHTEEAGSGYHSEFGSYELIEGDSGKYELLAAFGGPGSSITRVIIKCLDSPDPGTVTPYIFVKNETTGVAQTFSPYYDASSSKLYITFQGYLFDGIEIGEDCVIALYQ